MDLPSTTQAVAETLRRIESSERRSRAAFVGAFVFEGMFLASFLLLADLRDRTHLRLLLISAALITLGALWGIALAGVVNRHTLRVLRAVEMRRPPNVSGEPRGSRARLKRRARYGRIADLRIDAVKRQ